MAANYEFQPNPKRKGRNVYRGSWKESLCKPIPLPFTVEGLSQVLNWGAHPDQAPYTHQEIAHWCDRMHMQFLDTNESPALEIAIKVAADVDCQWDLFLANTYTLEQLQKLDFPAVRLPTQWFVDWQSRLINSKPSDPS